MRRLRVGRIDHAPPMPSMTRHPAPPSRPQISQASPKATQ
jgi:hypothetical protein